MFPFFSTKKMGKRRRKQLVILWDLGVSSFRKNVVKKGICQHTISFFLRKRWSNRSCFSHLLLCETTNPPFEAKVCFSCCQQNSQIFVSFLSLKFGVSKSVFLVLFFFVCGVFDCVHIFKNLVFVLFVWPRKALLFSWWFFNSFNINFVFVECVCCLFPFLNKPQNHEKGVKKKHQNQSFFNTQRKKEEIAFLLHLPLHEKVFSLVLTQKYPHIWTVLFAMKNKIGVFCWYFRQSVGLGHLVLGE